MSYTVEQKELAFFCTLAYVPFYVFICFVKLQLNVIDFSFCIHLLRDLFSLPKSKLFVLEMIGGSEMPGPIISVNQSTSMVNDCFPISSLSKYLKLSKRPALSARRYVTLLTLKATSKCPYVTSTKITFFKIIFQR